MTKNTTANASGAQDEVRRLQKKLKGIEASVSYSASLADAINRLANWMGGAGRHGQKGGK